MRWGILPLVLLLLLLLLPTRPALAEAYSFGVLSQRSAVLTAEYWNPILDYVQRRTGIRLDLKIARSAPESNAAIGQGIYDLVYSNTIFVPALSPAGYRVFLLPRAQDITGDIVTLESSGITSLEQLRDKVVGFPSRAAFVGYAVPMNHLLHLGISVKPVFGGNQEGIMGQLKAGTVAAAGVNGQVMAAFAAREGLRYRVLWQSETYRNLPISAHPRVPPAAVEALREAFAGMDADPEGQKVLDASAKVIGQKPPLGFLRSSNAEFENYIRFYETVLVKDIE